MKIKAIFLALIAFIICIGYQGFAQVVQLKSVTSYYSEIDSKKKLNWKQTNTDSNIWIEVNMKDDVVKFQSKETKLFEIIDYRSKIRKNRKSVEIAMLCIDEKGHKCIIKMKSSKHRIFTMLYIYYMDVAYGYECLVIDLIRNDKTR